MNTQQRMYAAHIEAGTVTRVLVVTDLAWPARNVAPGLWVDVSAVVPRPGEGWTYDGATFAPPAGA